LGWGTKKFNISSGKSGYDSDVSDAEWGFCCPYLVLMDQEAPQRTHDLRVIFNALRYVVRNGCRIDVLKIVERSRVVPLLLI